MERGSSNELSEMLLLWQENSDDLFLLYLLTRTYRKQFITN